MSEPLVIVSLEQMNGNIPCWWEGKTDGGVDVYVYYRGDRLAVGFATDATFDHLADDHYYFAIVEEISPREVTTEVLRKWLEGIVVLPEHIKTFD